MVTRLLVTGATGFIGKALGASFEARPGVFLRKAVRSNYGAPIADNVVVVGGLNSRTDWTDAVHGLSCVIHAAAQASDPLNGQEASLSQLQSVNVEGTLRLAQQAAEAGVRRFVFLSTAKVHGERSVRGRPFVETDPFQPEGPYARSKAEAEEALVALAKASGMEVVIIRPPMVYSAHAAGNFGTLVRLVRSGLPLPIAAISNQRSFLSLNNLVDFVWRCVQHPAAANQTFLVSDAADLSTPDLVRAIQRSLGRGGYLLPVPERVLRLAFRAIRRPDIEQRLCDDFQLDISKAQNMLQWVPPQRLENILSAGGKGQWN
ncbi:MAG: hypothetical protein CFE44_07410 [Burkholderiales bacterium PBB4]|nr:MAG: hypothetical protein CFE44_07410 [Burkholderiales bacterium PBB4]